MLKNYFKTALRNIARNKLFTTINVLGLAIGLCACLIIYLITSFELGFDKFHPDKERIFRVSSKDAENDFNDGDVPAPVLSAISRELTGVETVAGYFPYGNSSITVPANDKTVTKFHDDDNRVIITGPEYFSVFRYDWIAGSPAASASGPFKVVLSEHAARKYFGAMALTGIIGKELIYNDSLRVIISGIVKDWKGNTDFPYTDFISFGTVQASFLKNTRHMNEWGLMKGHGEYYWPICFVKLSKGADPSRIDGQLKKMIGAHFERAIAQSFSIFLQPLKDIHFDSSYSHDDIRKAHLPTLYGLMAIALFILIIAAINFINLSTAQCAQRAREITVRKVLGGSRRDLIFQCLIETFLLCIASATLALLFASPLLALFREFIPQGVLFDPFDFNTLLFLVLAIIVTTLMAGIYPARMIASFDPASILKGNAALKGNEKWLLRKGLIVFQFSISLIFIIGTLVIGKQIRFMLHSDFGLRTNAIVTLDNWSWQEDASIKKALCSKLKELPGVEKAILEFMPPMGRGQWTANIKYKSKQEISQEVSCDAGDEAFISFYGIKIIAGRNIIHSDSTAELLINEACAKALGFEKPEKVVGKFIYFNNKLLPIAGVVADFHQGSFRDPIRPYIISHQPTMEKSIGIKLASKGKEAAGITPVLSGIKKLWKAFYPDKEFSYSFMDGSIASLYEKEQKTVKLSQAAMSIAIFISCMGLFGLVMFTAEKRTKEIGIRKVLGATPADIMVLQARDFLALILIALIVASPIAWLAMHRWLQDFAYRIDMNGWVFIAAGTATALIAMATISFQAIKAANANPVKSLRAV